MPRKYVDILGRNILKYRPTSKMAEAYLRDHVPGLRDKMAVQYLGTNDPYG